MATVSRPKPVRRSASPTAKPRGGKRRGIRPHAPSPFVATCDTLCPEAQLPPAERIASQPKPYVIEKHFDDGDSTIRGLVRIVIVPITAIRDAVVSGDIDDAVAFCEKFNEREKANPTGHIALIDNSDLPLPMPTVVVEYRVAELAAPSAKGGAA